MKKIILIMLLLTIQLASATYLIGDLAENNYLRVYQPFNGSINSVFGSIAESLSPTSVRTLTGAANLSPVSYDYGGDGGITNPDYVYDTSLATYGYWWYTSMGGDYVEFEVNKSASDTGMVVRLKYDLYNYYATTLLGSDDVNTSISASCFNYYGEKVLYRIYAVGSYAQILLQCYDGGWVTIYTGISNANGRQTYIYDSRAYMTNQTSYVAFSNQNLNTEYYNKLDYLKYSNSYTFWGNNSVEALKNEVNNSIVSNSSGTIFNSSGANFDGVDDYINFTRQQSMNR